MRLSLSDPISVVVGIGSQYQAMLENLGITTVGDLLYHFPSRYEDWSQSSELSLVQSGEKVTVKGQLMSLTNIVTRNGKKMQKGIISDGQGSLGVVWFNQMYLLSALKIGTWLQLSGKVDQFGSQISLISPRFERIPPPEIQIDPATIHTGKLIGIYPETAGLTSNWIRAKVKFVLDHIDEITDYRKSLKVEFLPGPDLEQAIRNIHFPDTSADYVQARERLADDELIAMHLESLVHRQAWQVSAKAVPLLNSDLNDKFIRSLPFELTGAQKRAIETIVQDLGKDTAANRLIQGDVGSGKTVVAAAAAFIAACSGYQTAMMAPTEILANQHFGVLSKLLEPHNIKVALQTGRIKHVKEGSDDPFDILVGTHALLSEVVNFDKLGLVIIDEQHRFGVAQRTKLISKGSSEFKPHLLSMSATPIPRTIALTLYGDLDITVIDELPPGRQIVKTRVVSDEKRNDAHEWILEQTREHKTQTFIVCPFIEVSETQDSVKAATVEYVNLQKVFPTLRLGLLHGSLTGNEKDQVLEDFKNKKLDILVTTPVVEVGVDIPNATIMVIEGAERFGLAQLHQLRGRVGRGDRQSYCFLFTSDNESSSRLKALENTHNGLALAELDLRLRGPGQLYGTSQSGFVNFKLASYGDSERIARTHRLASEIFSNGELGYLNNSYLMRKIQDVAPN